MLLLLCGSSTTATPPVAPRLQWEALDTFVPGIEAGECFVPPEEDDEP